MNEVAETAGPEFRGRLSRLLHLKTMMNWKNATPVRVYELKGKMISVLTDTEPDKIICFEYPSFCTEIDEEDFITLNIWDVRTKTTTSFPWNSPLGLDVGRRLKYLGDVYTFLEVKLKSSNLLI